MQNSRIHIFIKFTQNLTKINHVVCHNTNLNKFKIIPTVQSVSLTTMELEINGVKYLEKSPTIWKLKNTFLNDSWVKKKSKGKSERVLS